MTARSDLTPGANPGAALQQPAPARPALLPAAIGVSAAGGLLTGLGPLIGLVSPGASAAFTAWPLLLVLALLPAAAATALLRTGSPTTAAALLVGPAVLAPGRAALDVQLIVDAGLAARPELLRVATLSPTSPGAGSWLLLTGHLAGLLAGLLAVRGMRTGERGESGAHRQGLLAVVLCTGIIGGVGMLMAPFVSDDPYLLARAAADAPAAVLVGALLLAVGVPAAGGVLAGSDDADFARGGLLGLAAALAAVAVPPLAAVAALGQLRLGWGPVLGVLAALVLAGLAVPAGRGAPAAEQDRDLRLPPFDRLARLAGALAAAGGALALLAAVLPVLEMPPGVTDPSTYPSRLLLPAGVVLVGSGLAVLLPAVRSQVRPVLTVVWVVVPFAAAAMFDSVLTAVQAIGASAGPGMWTAGAAVLLSGASGVTAALAGGVERDDVDLTEVSMRGRVLVPALLGVLLAGGAYAVPVVSSAEYAPPAVFGEFSTTSWGLLIALFGVVGAAVLAPMCRPVRAGALLAGAAAVAAVRALEYPLTEGRVADSAPGLGLWFAIACVVVLASSAAGAASRED
ncbi:hypothetical protein IQ251_11590 [Saccharopolyspora sp. HNM0983]|uniref:Uncharacterized protein n=1 Tax=Saccharopolyspora montiporae TaxID=2781240 RepID=A0A929G085_9PSEU|nr:hypothetical protein [Saccharopolyspora sp. HNM0983]MBE9375084.1 hypothetical protein [Saccharopolyspora sp. HNM0983]